MGQQNFITPPELMAAIKKKWGISYFAFDLAATKDANQSDLKHAFLGPGSGFQVDSLSVDWPCYFNIDKGYPNWFWLNPPYKNVRPWIEKTLDASQRGMKIATLTIASVGSNWWRDLVLPNALIIFLKPRVKFIDPETNMQMKAGFTKDLALCLWDNNRIGDITWDWQKR